MNETHKSNGETHGQADKLLTTAQAADYLSMTARFLEARRIRGGGPKFVAISARAVRYRLSDLQEWVQALAKTSTSEQ